VTTCSHCGEKNSDRARFCQACGARLAEGEVLTDVRRMVTIVFSDIVDSTGLSARLEPESFRQIMTRYFSEVRACLEKHGGTVEKFIGDAVMAVFGVPDLHEDDALRAVRAAAEMRDSIARLNGELQSRWDVRIEVRTAVNTGLVVAGNPVLGQTLVTGDAVNVAARLQDRAGPSEILMGTDTYRLVRDAVSAEPRRPFALKGIEGRVRAFRLEDVLPQQPRPARRLQAPLVGREHEMGLLYESFERVVTKGRCRMFNVFGAVGVGKSRLAEEFMRGVEDDAIVLEGRCLSYGEGSTFWPLLQVVKQAAAIPDADAAHIAQRKIAGLLGGGEPAQKTAGAVMQLIGLRELRTPARDGFWAVHDFFGTLALQRPVVLCLDDIHWAEPTLLELLKGMVEELADSPVLILCVARNEILDQHPGWLEDETNSSSVILTPLSDDECRRIVEYALGKETPSREAQDRIVESAEGNPLFLAELLAMLIDEGLLVRGDGRYVLDIHPAALNLPPTIHALLAARLDRLSPMERPAIEAASVIGEFFYLKELLALCNEAEADDLEKHLYSLVDRELIGEAKSRFSDDRAFNFRHTLVRDVAYEGISKGKRARMHELLARHLEKTARGWSRWFQEIVGYHFERAHNYRSELGQRGELTDELARRAGEQLGAAGRKAHVGGDMPAAATLLGRAAALLRGDERARLELLAPLSDALAETGQVERAIESATEAIEGARHFGLRGVEAHALTVLMKLPRRPGFKLSLGYGIGHTEGFRHRGD
jgi:class 3 adenylate cyclase